MVQLNKIESGSMINLSHCRQQADLIDEAAIEVGQLIHIYNDATYYMGKNDNNDSDSYEKKFYNEEMKLRNIKKDLGQIATKIRTKSQEIYNEELAEQRRKEAEAEATNQN